MVCVPGKLSGLVADLWSAGGRTAVAFQVELTDAERSSAIQQSETLRYEGMMSIESRRFVTAAEKVDFVSPWTLEEWLCRGDVVPNRELLMVRANMEAGRSHPFHTHPTREEIIYVLSGRAEQWIGREHRVLGPGEMVLIPKGEVHGTYNPYRERLVFLAILAPANAPDPAIVDVSNQAPWTTMREGMVPCE